MKRRRKMLPAIVAFTLLVELMAVSLFAFVQFAHLHYPPEYVDDGPYMNQTCTVRPEGTYCCEPHETQVHRNRPEPQINYTVTDCTLYTLT